MSKCNCIYSRQKMVCVVYIGDSNESQSLEIYWFARISYPSRG